MRSVGLSGVPARAGDVPLWITAQISLTWGQIHSSGRRSEFAVLVGITSPCYQHGLPGAAGCKVLQRSNAGSCKSCTAVTGA